MGLAEDRGMARRKHSGVEKQSAVAIFRQRGESVEPADDQPRLGQRLDQRVGQPLRQLVQRHQTRAGTGAAGGRMRPHVAEVDAAECEPARPDLAEPHEHRTQDLGGLDSTRT